MSTVLLFSAGCCAWVCMCGRSSFAFLAFVFGCLESRFLVAWCLVLGGLVLGCSVLGGSVLGCSVLGYSVLGCSVLGCSVLGGLVLGGLVVSGSSADAGRARFRWSARMCALHSSAGRCCWSVGQAKSDVES